MGGAMLSKSSIQFSVDGWGCVPSLLFDLRPNYGKGNEDNRLPWWHLSTMRETRVPSLGWEDPLEKEMAPTPVLLPGKYHGLRSLVGYSPWGRKESDTTEQLHFHFQYIHSI